MTSENSHTKDNPRTDIMGFPIYCADLSTIRFDGKLVVVNTLNAYSYVRAKSDPGFTTALMNSDALMADGFPVVTAARILKGKKIMKTAGADIFHHFCRELQKTGGSCFFLGSSETTLSLIRNRMALDYPAVKVNTFSPPYKAEFTNEDNHHMLDAISRFSPDVLFVGMTAPKQEKWVEACKDSIKAGIVCSIGAVFDFYAGTIKRPSGFWISLNLEWFIRLLNEPRRLWKRYLVYSPLFFLDMLKYLFKISR
jgi:N-acetylglucosaminyldiphosphoundecaprenol N-acetyl-beta-D-mannosaminyltransferase